MVCWKVNSFFVIFSIFLLKTLKNVKASVAIIHYKIGCRQEYLEQRNLHWTLLQTILLQTFENV